MKGLVRSRDVENTDRALDVTRRPASRAHRDLLKCFSTTVQQRRLMKELRAVAIAHDGSPRSAAAKAKRAKKKA
jgi:hypothetical protein